MERRLPEALLEELKGVPGFDREAFLEAHSRPAAVSVRLHPIKGKGLFPEAGKVPWCDEGRYLVHRPVFTLDPLFHAGAYYVQEASSMFLDHMVRSLYPNRSNLRVLDLCGAPGGKSTLLASLLEPSSLLISNEVIRTRIPILEENIIRWGYTNNWVSGNDARDFGRLKGYFDLIVVDAPCSGSGLFRKDAHALNEWSEANVQLCAQRQERILADVWPALKEDGILIYATCSYSPQEDEEILDWLAKEFEVDALQVETKDEWGVVAVSSLKHNMRGYRFFPDKVGGEGFFIAAMRKTGQAEKMRADRFKSKHDKQAWEQAKQLVSRDDLVCIARDKNEFVAVSSMHEEDISLLSKHIYLRKTGLSLGSWLPKDWIPAHELALSNDRSATIKTIALDKEHALKFLRKDDSLPLNAEKGWWLVTYGGLGLGWIKSLGNRFNNYLPKHWRIRMELPGEETDYNCTLGSVDQQHIHYVSLPSYRFTDMSWYKSLGAR
jgi:16S rRNA C967 or C1407 C5-methylase (RsmB/RsmF family)/NOL1/NOP2/fmu family ribosome biogenesis protein